MSFPTKFLLPFLGNICSYFSTIRDRRGSDRIWSDLMTWMDFAVIWSNLIWYDDLSKFHCGLINALCGFQCDLVGSYLIWWFCESHYDLIRSDMSNLSVIPMWSDLNWLGEFQCDLIGSDLSWLFEGISLWSDRIWSDLMIWVDFMVIRSDPIGSDLIR